MKHYLNIYPMNTSYGYPTAEEARRCAGSNPVAVAVEIELPDPPTHETLVDRLTEIVRLCDVARDEDADVWRAFGLVQQLCEALIDYSEVTS